jgi:hypothetical protein
MLHNEELRVALLTVVIKTWTRNVARMGGGGEMHTECWQGNLPEGGHLVDEEGDGRKKLRRVLGKSFKKL